MMDDKATKLAQAIQGINKGFREVILKCKTELAAADERRDTMAIVKLKGKMEVLDEISAIMGTEINKLCDVFGVKK